MHQRFAARDADRRAVEAVADLGPFDDVEAEHEVRALRRVGLRAVAAHDRGLAVGDRRDVDDERRHGLAVARVTQQQARPVRL